MDISFPMSCISFAFFGLSSIRWDRYSRYGPWNIRGFVLDLLCICLVRYLFMLFLCVCVSCSSNLALMPKCSGNKFNCSYVSCCRPCSGLCTREFLWKKSLMTVILVPPCLYHIWGGCLRQLISLNSKNLKGYVNHAFQKEFLENRLHTCCILLNFVMLKN